MGVLSLPTKIFPTAAAAAAAAPAAKSLQSCPTLCDPIDGSPPGSCPWDSPGKNTGVGCHFLLQCMKVESESEVAQSCPTLRDPMDCSLPGSSIHGIFQARVLEWVAIAFSSCVPRRRQSRFFWYTMFCILKIQIFPGAGYFCTLLNSTLAWKIPWMEEPGGLQSMGSLRVGHD